MIDDEPYLGGVYRYLAGYKHGHRVAREKRFFGVGVKRINTHAADKGGRMYWCDCFPGWRLNGKPRWAMGPKRHKTFKHHRGSKIRTAFAWRGRAAA